MFYVYVLKSLKDSKFYVGFTKDLKKRINEHNQGKVISTKYRRPFELIYYSPREMLQRSNPDTSGLFHRVKHVKIKRMD